MNRDKLSNKATKIIVSSNYAWTVFNFRSRLIRTLMDTGYEVIVVTKPDAYTDKIRALGCEVYNIDIDLNGTNPIRDLKTLFQFYLLYNKIKPDICLHFTIKPNIYGTLAAKLLGIPTINNIAGLGTAFAAESFLARVARILYRVSQAGANHVFFQNQQDCQQFIDLNIVKPEHLSVLPGSGVDLQRFKPVERIANDRFTFLLMGRLLWDKGIGEFVEAARRVKAQYPDTCFQLLGFVDVNNASVISKEQLDAWIDEGIVEYLGTSDNIENEIALADCVVLPSYYKEGTPRSLLEAAAMERPIITTNNVGCADVVDDGVNGYICKIKDSDDLASKMVAMLNLKPEVRAKMGRAGRELIQQKFDESIVLNRYHRVILEQIHTSSFGCQSEDF